LAQYDLENIAGQNVLFRLERLMNRDPRRDGLYLPSQAGVGVRIMNLHKAKGLEARVVILADSMGNQTRKNGIELHVDRSGGSAQGYMKVSKKTGPFSDKALAYPAQWPALEQQEEAILSAEKQRLLYVAATRAKDLLVVCYRTSTEGDANKNNPWFALLAHLGGASHLELDSERQPTPGTAQQSQQVRFSGSVGSLETAWTACMTPQAAFVRGIGSKMNDTASKWGRIMAG
jgi:ATP-dependent helicase/nuclease subunit A